MATKNKSSRKIFKYYLGQDVTVLLRIFNVMTSQRVFMINY